MPKRILIVAAAKPVEALRVAAGLTLADAELQVMSLGTLPEGDAAAAQMEALEFADIVPQALQPADAASWSALARAVMASDMVYVL